MSTLSKEKHDKIQRDLAVFQKKSNSMLDFAVYSHINAGETDINNVSKKVRLTKESLVSKITSSLFKVTGDRISIV